MFFSVPAKISEDLEDEIHECAESLYELINCRHYARVDFILDKDAQKLADEAAKSSVCIPIGEGENCW